MYIVNCHETRDARRDMTDALFGYVLTEVGIRRAVLLRPRNQTVLVDLCSTSRRRRLLRFFCSSSIRPIACVYRVPVLFS